MLFLKLQLRTEVSATPFSLCPQQTSVPGAGMLSEPAGEDGLSPGTAWSPRLTAPSPCPLGCWGLRETGVGSHQSGYATSNKSTPIAEGFLRMGDTQLLLFFGFNPILGQRGNSHSVSTQSSICHMLRNKNGAGPSPCPPPEVTGRAARGTDAHRRAPSPGSGFQAVVPGLGSPYNSFSEAGRLSEEPWTPAQQA